MLVLVRVEREAVEPKSVDKHVRSLAHFALADEMSINLSINNCDLLAREHPGIFVEGSQRLEIKEGSSPCIGANKGKITPLDAHSSSEPSLKRTHCAFARCGGALSHHRKGVRLRWQWP